MQTERQIRVSYGRKLKAVLLALGSLTPLLSSAWSFDYVWQTVTKTCYIEDFYWQPNDQKDRRVILRMHMLKDADIALSVQADHTYNENGKSKHEIRGDVRPGLTWMEARFDFHHYKKGETIDFEIVVPYSQMHIGYEEQHLDVETRVLVKPETVESWNVQVPYGYIAPTEFSLKGGHSFTNSKCFGGYYNGQQALANAHYVVVSSKDLKDEYEVDSQGILPLKEMRFHKQEYDYSLTPLTMMSGEVRFYNYLDDFHIGTRKVDEKNNPYITVPLKLIPDGRESYLRSKKLLYVKEDIRHETNEYHSEDQGYGMTYTIFLPPVRGMQARFYDCQIRLEGVGDQNADTLIHDFKVFRYSNDVGPKINSRYYVTEVKTDV